MADMLPVANGMRRLIGLSGHLYQDLNRAAHVQQTDIGFGLIPFFPVSSARPSLT